MGLCSGLAQSPVPQPDPGPVQAELLANLDVRHLGNGKTIFASITQDWNGLDCLLRKGAILEGTVEESISRQGNNESKLALSFKRAQCNGREMQPMDLVLTVIAQPPTDWSKVPNAQFKMTMDFPNPRPFGPSYGPALTNQPQMQSPQNAAATPTTGQNNSYDDYTFSKLALTQLELSAVEHRFPVRKNVRPGDVIDMKGLRLDIGTGPNRSSVISSKNRDVYLAEFTQILLMPPARAFRAPKGTAATATVNTNGRVVAEPTPSAAPPSLPPPNEIAICAPPGCAVDLPVSAQELKSHSAGSIAIRGLGYTRRTNRVIAGFADEESLAWLGPGQLLFSFIPHQPILRRRSEQGGTTRLVRAVLLDTATHNVVRAVDWEIVDSRRYLWQLDAERILVHVGNELRVYRAGMQMERSFPLAGPLIFVRIAPSGGLLAIATLRERHSLELHAKLRSELGREPEEDVDVAILNEDFKTVAMSATVSNLMPPTLLDEGQVRLQSEPAQWYRLQMFTWENKRSALARFHSFCTPEVASTAPDLLFLLTCNAPTGDILYSVLRNDGKMLMRGASEPNELGHEAIGSRRSQIFAVKIVHAERPISSGTNFKNSELDSEEVRVYRADDGRRLLSVRVSEPIGSHGGYALSPDGSQLAVLSGSDIHFFPVPAK